MLRATRSFDRIICLALSCLALVLLTQTAAAQGRPLDAPRAQGIVGERYDGLLVLRKSSAPNSVKQLVNSTNAQRLKLYKNRAKQTKASVKAVGMIYAKEIMKGAPPGTWFLSESGKWAKR